METPTVAVIGAGPSGLATMKELLQNGFKVTCFEGNKTVGGLWSASKHSSIYESVVVNNSKELLQFSDFPIPTDWPMFLTFKKVEEYLEMYCDHFDLRKHIKFRRIVENIVQDDNGKWKVSYQSLSKNQPTPNQSFMNGNLANERTSHESNGDEDVFMPKRFSTSSESSSDSVEYPKETIITNEATLQRKPSYAIKFPKYPIKDKRYKVTQKTVEFDFVVVCTGHHWKPNKPDFKGMGKFKGDLIHSHQYKVPYPFKDQKTLVVGVGNSGLDISSELANVSEQVFLSSRSGSWISPRTTLFGVSTDHLNTRAIKSIPRVLLNFVFESLIQLHHGDLTKYHLKPNHSFLESTPVVGGTVLQHIQSGKIKVVPNIAQFLDKERVEFEDGSIETFDSVILCTGYKIENNFIDQSILKNDSRIQLYKHVFPTKCDGIAFVGLVQPTGSVLPVSEMQARWVSNVFKAKCKLPSFDERMKSSEADWKLHLQKFANRDRLVIAVDQTEYMDELAEFVGCKPNFWDLVKKDPLLAAKVIFGPFVAAQYRLYGDGQWTGASEVINEACFGIDIKAKAASLLSGVFSGSSGTVPPPNARIKENADESSKEMNEHAI